MFTSLFASKAVGWVSALTFAVCALAGVMEIVVKTMQNLTPAHLGLGSGAYLVVVTISAFVMKGEDADLSNFGLAEVEEGE